MKIIKLIFLLSISTIAYGQDSLTKIQFNGYAETYICYDVNQPQDHNRPGFIYSHNRHNEANLNLGYIKASLTRQKTRANLSIMAGTYANANLAAEPGVLKNIFEANIGIKISKTKNIWVDAGIFPSHIGFESAISRDCWNLTRSILADNSPYYEAGAKITYISKNEKLQISGLLLNGWQRIQRTDNNNTPAFGHQLTYKPTGKITLNSSSFIGSDSPDSLRKMRYFHNFYAQIQLTKKTGIIAGFDYGMQQQFKNSDKYHSWYSPVLIIRQQVRPNTFIAVRGEYYSDINQVIIANGTPFECLGYSINIDHLIEENVLFRIEARGLTNQENYFTRNDKTVRENYFFTTSLAVSF